MNVHEVGSRGPREVMPGKEKEPKSALLTPAFLEQLGALDASGNINDYYVTFHAEKGFSLEKKFRLFGFVGYAVDAVVTAWNAFRGYSYAFDANVQRFAECIDQNWEQIPDVKATLRSCKNLERIADHVLRARNSDPTLLTDRLERTFRELLAHKAEREHVSPLDLAARSKIFDVARQLIERGESVAAISQEGKNALLGYYLECKDVATAERLMAAGADPKSQEKRLLALAPQLLQSPASLLHGYYLVPGPTNGLQLIKKDTVSDIVGQVLQPTIESWEHVQEKKEIFTHNIAKISKYLEEHAAKVQDPKACLIALGELQSLADGHSSELVAAAKSSFLHKTARRIGVSPLELVVSYDLFGEARAMIDRGARLEAISLEAKNRLLGHYLDSREVGMAERLMMLGADPKSQEQKFSPLLSRFLENPSSHLKDYCILHLPPNGLELIKADALKESIQESVNQIVNQWRFYSRNSRLLSHNVQMVVKALQAPVVANQDVKGCLDACSKLEKKISDRELQEALTLATFDFLANCAKFAGVSPLELACRHSLFHVAEQLIELQADMSTLSDESKTKLFGYFLDKSDFEELEMLLIFGAKVAAYKERLKPFLNSLISEKKSELAVALLDAGVARDEKVLNLAVVRGLLPVVQKLASLGENLRIRDGHNYTLLHIAAFSGHFELLEWLSTRLDVSVKNEGKVPYDYVRNEPFFKALPKLEQAFLLDNVAACSNILSYLRPQDAIQELNALRAKYPASYIDHILYSINRAHFENQMQVAIPPEVAPGCSLDEMLTFFDQVNFTRSDRPNYADPANFQSDTGTTNLHDLKNILREYLNKVHNRTAYIGTPRGGTQALEVFYNTIERAITHTIRALKDMPESEAKKAVIKRTVVEYVRSGRYCGGKLYANAYQQYVAVVKGRTPTFKDEILEILGNYREVLFTSLVPQGDQSVHDFNRMMQQLGTELGIPGAEMMASFEDQYVGSGVNMETVRKEFHWLYSTRNIIFECMKQQIEQSSELRGKLFDWFKVNLPPEWERETFQAILEEVALKPTDKEKIDYLQTKDIFVAPNQTIEEAIEDERRMQYLAREVVVDMNAPKMEIKPQAIAYMLQRMGVLKAVYDWSYYEPIVGFGKAIASIAWRGVRSVFKGLLGP